MVVKTYLNSTLAFFVLFSLTAVSATVHAKIIYVDDDAVGANDGSSWTDAFNFLQDALVAVNDGDEIRVARGTYKPDQGVGITPGDRKATFQLINGVTLKGGYAGFAESDPNARDIEFYETILSGDLDSNDIDTNYPWGLWNEPSRAENSLHVVTGSGTDQTPVLDGFTITAGNANGPWPDNRGGGMYNLDCNPTLIKCTFNKNSTYLGGAVYNYQSSPTMIYCIFSENESGAGGGMVNKYCSPTMINCIFSGNSAHGTGVGTAGVGGMYNYKSSPTITNCTFSGNYGGEGGMYNDSSNPVITNCTFSGNYFSGMVNHESSVILNNCMFSTNHADSPWGTGAGGAMYNWGSDLTLTNCTFAQNSANMGDALACYSYEQRWPSNLELTNCILWNDSNEIWNYDNSTIKITYCNIHGGWPGEGNIDVDPLFVGLGYWANPNDPNIVGDPNDPNAIWIDGDYHLLEGSPSIDTGDPNYVAEPNETDLDGNPRVLDGDNNGIAVVDMGAYEYNLVISAKARVVPQTINLVSKGNWITSYIWLPDEYDVVDIEPDSIFLEDEIQPEQFSVDEQQQVATARFTREDVLPILEVGEIELTITGRLTDGTVFEAKDMITVIDKGQKRN